MKKLLYVTAAAAVMLASCKKDKVDNPQQEDNPQPKFNIVELGFGVRQTERPSVEDVQAALAAGADSVYLVSMENFDLTNERNTIHVARDGGINLTAISPRVRGKGVINPKVEVAAVVDDRAPGEFEAMGFKYIPGYIKPN